MSRRTDMSHEATVAIQKSRKDYKAPNYFHKSSETISFARCFKMNEMLIKLINVNFFFYLLSAYQC